MGQGGQPREGERQDLATRATTRVRDEPDPARVVLVALVVEGSARVGHGGRAAVSATVHGWSPEWTERPPVVKGGDKRPRERTSGGRRRRRFGTREEPVPSRQATRSVRTGRRPPRGRR